MASTKRLGDLLVEANLLTKENLEKALRLQVGSNRRLGYLLIKMGFITEQQLHTTLSEQLDLPITDIHSEFSTDVKHVLPKYLCSRYNVIPLKTGSHNTLKVAMVDPSDNEAVSDIEKYTGKVIEAALAPQNEIQKAIRSNIPISLRDFFNTRTSSRVTATLIALSLALILLLASQYYNDKQRDLYGTITRKATSTLYENHDLIIGFEDSGKVSLVGHGAHAPGYYSITFDNTAALQKFLERKRADLSTKQTEWVNWVVTKQ